jgi:hypothetical protein
LAWIDNYCQANPIRDITDAAIAFEKERPRPKEFPPTYFGSPLGVGTETCGSWTAARKNPDGLNAHLEAQWVVGFLSGASMLHEGIAHDGKAPLKEMDGRGVWAWIDNDCQAHPVEAISDAAEFFDMYH